MAKVRTTLTIEDEVLKAVKVRAARAGRGDSEVIEEALRRDLRLDFLATMWAQASLADNEADALALEAQHRTRPGPPLLKRAGSPRPERRHLRAALTDAGVGPGPVELERRPARGHRLAAADRGAPPGTDLPEAAPVHLTRGQRGCRAVARGRSKTSRRPGRGPAGAVGRHGDDYLVALAAVQHAALVSGDRHLLELSETIPLYSPRDFLELIPR